MPHRDAAKRLTEYCRESAGGQLRGVLAYSGDDVEIEYLREDLEDAYSDAELDRVTDVAVAIHEIRTDHHTADTPLGRPGPSLRVYANAVVLQLPLDESQGVIATFDPGIARNLLSFVQECQDRVRDE